MTQLPESDRPEIAFAGRSNVGKSSVLGMILASPKLVRTSRTPGRTQALNLFSFEDRVTLADLPGYGYAKLPKDLRRRLQTMLVDYVSGRAPLLGVALLIDLRREGATDDDRWFAAKILEARRQLLLVLTKADLVAKNRLLAATRRVEADLGVEAGVAVVCSAKTGAGRAELVARIGELVAGC
ncbi:MAG: ribosome biogenesis GTP-binding protein YsxC [Deltaproteobacteria bacterium]|nr:ribosome biogenesis GTP-binding protein YsxC [Deltaproteobacteria bacterium]